MLSPSRITCGLCAVPDDVAEYPELWSACPPAVMATLYTLEVYSRASLCGSESLTSVDYKAQTSRDDSWLRFHAYTNRCASWLPAGVAAGYVW